MNTQDFEVKTEGKSVGLGRCTTSSSKERSVFVECAAARILSRHKLEAQRIWDEEWNRENAPQPEPESEGKPIRSFEEFAKRKLFALVKESQGKPMPMMHG